MHSTPTTTKCNSAGCDVVGLTGRLGQEGVHGPVTAKLWSLGREELSLLADKASRRVRVFPNRDALLRLATAVLLDEDWATSDHIYVN